jgi:hypothetical protein
VVATLTPAPGAYNVVATATMRSQGTVGRCQAMTVNSHGTATSSTPLGDFAGSRTGTATGGMVVQPGSVIEEMCGGTSISGGSFVSGTIKNVTLTAVAVNTISGTRTGSAVRAITTKKTGGRPVNSFIRTAKQLCGSRCDGLRPKGAK